MAIQVFPLPLSGIHEGFNPEDTPEKFSGYMNNVRPVDTLETRIRLGQRPGLKKWASQQIGGEAQAIIEMGIVSAIAE